MSAQNKQYWTCPYCEANLDFGEKCDCLEIASINAKIHKAHKKAMNILREYEGGISNETEN